VALAVLLFRILDICVLDLFVLTRFLGPFQFRSRRQITMTTVQGLPTEIEHAVSDATLSADMTNPPILTPILTKIHVRIVSLQHRDQVHVAKFRSDVVVADLVTVIGLGAPMSDDASNTGSSNTGSSASSTDSSSTDSSSTGSCARTHSFWVGEYELPSNATIADACRAAPKAMPKTVANAKSNAKGKGKGKGKGGDNKATSKASGKTASGGKSGGKASGKNGGKGGSSGKGKSGGGKGNTEDVVAIGADADHPLIISHASFRGDLTMSIDVGINNLAIWIGRLHPRPTTTLGLETQGIESRETQGFGTQGLGTLETQGLGTQGLETLETQGLETLETQGLETTSKAGNNETTTNKASNEQTTTDKASNEKASVEAASLHRFETLWWQCVDVPVCMGVGAQWVNVNDRSITECCDLLADYFTGGVFDTSWFPRLKTILIEQQPASLHVGAAAKNFKMMNCAQTMRQTFRRLAPEALQHWVSPQKKLVLVRASLPPAAELKAMKNGARYTLHKRAGVAFVTQQLATDIPSVGNHKQDDYADALLQALAWHSTHQDEQADLHRKCTSTKETKESKALKKESKNESKAKKEPKEPRARKEPKEPKTKKQPKPKKEPKAKKEPKVKKEPNAKKEFDGTETSAQNGALVSASTEDPAATKSTTTDTTTTTDNITTTTTTTTTDTTTTTTPTDTTPDVVRDGQDNTVAQSEARSEAHSEVQSEAQSEARSEAHGDENGGNATATATTKTRKRKTAASAASKSVKKPANDTDAIEPANVHPEGTNVANAKTQEAATGTATTNQTVTETATNETATGTTPTNETATTGTATGTTTTSETATETASETATGTAATETNPAVPAKNVGRPKKQKAATSANGGNDTQKRTRLSDEIDSNK
jgi:hypothetical protein